MTGMWFLLGAYVLSLTLLWGYAALLWYARRRIHGLSSDAASAR